MEALSKLNNISSIAKNVPEIRHEEILESKTDATEWKLEVERVLPQLKVTIKTDNKDWRTHIEQMHTYQESIDESLKETKNYFEKLYDEISRTLEKINSREKYINSQLDEPMQNFRNYQDRLSEIKETYRNRSSGINERTQLLSGVTNDLQRIKEEMEEAGQSMTDGCKCSFSFLYQLPVY
jgi:estrogen-related receptor beta like 1